LRCSLQELIFNSDTEQTKFMPTRIFFTIDDIINDVGRNVRKSNHSKTSVSTGYIKKKKNHIKLTYEPSSISSIIESVAGIRSHS